MFFAPDFHLAMAANLQPLASLANIERTPSREDGIPQELEEDLRAYGCKLIHQAGILLKQCVEAAIQHMQKSESMGPGSKLQLRLHKYSSRDSGSCPR